MSTKHIHMVGQSLVEVVVIVGIVILTLTALILATTQSLRTTTSDKTRSIAVKYAQEGIEIVRAERDKGWDGLVALALENNGQYCLGSDGAFVAGPCTEVNENNLQRTVTLVSVPTPSPPSTVPYLNVVVAVSWVDSSRANPVTLTTRLTQWK